jgi:GntR family transcriptional regulator, galactonate operon transcriptional repressor
MLSARRYPRRGAHGETVYEIVRRVVSGELQPGDLLPEGELIAELDISRTVLREAIKVLGAKGLVEARPRIGTKVRPRSHWRLMDPDVLAWQTEGGFDEQFLRNLAEVRSLIEPGAARLAAERATEEEIAILEKAYNQMEAHVVNSEAFIAADMQFHFVILAACRNEILEQMSSAIGEALEISRRVTVELPGSSEAHLPLHEAVVEAIRRRDADAAETAMGKLIEVVRRDVERFLQRKDHDVESRDGNRGGATGTTALRLIQGTRPAAGQRKNSL